MNAHPMRSYTAAEIAEAFRKSGVAGMDADDLAMTEEDAEDRIAAELIAAGGVSELVATMRGIRYALRCVMDRREVPQSERGVVDLALEAADRFQKRVDAQMERQA